VAQPLNAFFKAKEKQKYFYWATKCERGVSHIFANRILVISIHVFLLSMYVHTLVVGTSTKSIIILNAIRTDFITNILLP